MALIKVSCHCCVIVGFNVVKITLEPFHDTITCLSYILDPTSSAGNQLNDIFTLAVNINLTTEIPFVGSGLYFTAQI